MFGDPLINSKGFEVVPLGQISTVQIGPFGTMLHKSDYITGGIPLINPTHIKQSQIKSKSDLTITKDKYDELPQYHLEEGDIIMGRCAIVEGISVGYFCGTGSLFIRPNTDVLRPRFINDLLSSASIKRWFEEQSLGATMANLNKGIVNSVPVPLPDLSTQVRYEKVLNNITSRLQNHRQLSQEIDENFNSLMQRAFKGELELKDVA
jgi:type I restriction enzyme S subunit